MFGLHTCLRHHMQAWYLKRPKMASDFLKPCLKNKREREKLEGSHTR